MIIIHRISACKCIFQVELKVDYFNKSGYYFCIFQNRDVQDDYAINNASSPKGEKEHVKSITNEARRSLNTHTMIIQ